MDEPSVIELLSEMPDDFKVNFESSLHRFIHMFRDMTAPEIAAIFVAITIVMRAHVEVMNSDPNIVNAMNFAFDQQKKGRVH